MITTFCLLQLLTEEFIEKIPQFFQLAVATDEAYALEKKKKVNRKVNYFSLFGGEEKLKEKKGKERENKSQDFLFIISYLLPQRKLEKALVGIITIQNYDGRVEGV